MPRLNRSEVCAAKTVAREVIYSHRKEWIRRRREELAGIFGIEVLGFAAMSNHLQVVVRDSKVAGGPARRGT